MSKSMSMRAGNADDARSSSPDAPVSSHSPLAATQAWDGDYQPLINCIVENINTSLVDVEQIMA